MPEIEYDAFISYSRALDGTLAPALQRGMQRFAKPWYRMRALRVFRDDESLSANPGLWSSIEKALGSSRWLVLLASPEAKESKWVGEEVEWWLANKSTDSLLIALTSGEFDDAVPDALREAMPEEPRWVDLRWLREVDHVDQANPRLRECVADLASAVHGVAKDTLVGEHVRQHRRTVRLARGAVTALAVLTVAVLVAAFIAVGQRDTARQQTRTATARGLASAAVANLRTDVGLAQLLAVQGYRLEPNAQTRAALFQSATASPQLGTYLPVGARVTALTASADGKVAVAGTEDGRVVRWDLAGGGAKKRVTEQKVAERPVTAVAASADGGVAAAFAEGTAVRWDSGGTHEMEVPDDHSFGLVAVSPSGRFTTVYSTLRDQLGIDRPSGRRSVHDAQTGRSTDQVEDSSVPPLFLRAPDESTIVEISDYDWVRRSMSTLEITGRVQASLLYANSSWAGVSANGDYFGYSTGGDTRLWRTSQQAPGFDTHDHVVPDGRLNPGAIAVADDGARTAVVDDGTIHVYDMAGEVPGERLRLEGNSDTSFVEFLGDNDHLVSASGDRLVRWDLTRNTRLGTVLTMRTPLACRACPAPWLATSHGKIAVATQDWLAVGQHTAEADPDDDFGPPVWTPDGNRVLLVSTPGGRGEIWDTGDALRRSGQWPAKIAAEHVLAARMSVDGDRLVTVNELGDVQVIDGTTFEAVRTVEMGLELRHGGWPPSSDLAAVSADAATVAISTEQNVVLVDTRTGEHRDLPGGPARAVTFTGDSLVVQRTGSIEVWDSSGTQQRRSIAGDPGYADGIVASPDTSVVALRRNDDTMTLRNLVSGELIGVLSLDVQVYGLARLTGMAFTDDRKFVTAVSEAPLMSWDLAEENWMRNACESAGRDLTADEWRRYVGTEPPGDLSC